MVSSNSDRKERLALADALELAPGLQAHRETALRVIVGLRGQGDNYAAGAVENLLNDIVRLVDGLSSASDSRSGTRLPGSRASVPYT